MSEGQAGAAAGGAGDLSEAEAALVAAALAGGDVDLGRREVRATIVRDLLLEARPGWVLPPAGLRLRRAIIQGCLDLDGATLTKPLLIWHSRFEGGGEQGALILRDGRFKRVGIHSSTVLGAIVADRADIDNGLYIGGGVLKGTLQVRGATIGGALALEGSEVGDGTAAVLGAGVRVSGPLIVRRVKAAGEIAVPRAHLGSGIYADGLMLVHDGVAFNCESARIGGDVLLGGAEIKGRISLLNTRLEGRLAAARLVVDGVPVAIDARGLDVSHGIDLDHARIKGSVLIEGAVIGKAFHAEAIEIDGGETALGADVITVGGNLEMPRAKLIGQVALPGARIEGQLRLTEARLFGTDVALRADGARIHGGLFLSRATVLGMVRLPAAEIGNQFRLRGASIKVEAGAALLAAGASFRRDVELSEGCQTVGAVILDQARIAGALDLKGGQLVSAAFARGGLPPPGAHAGAVVHADDLVLSLIDAEVNRLAMPMVAGDRPRGIVQLARARIGSLEDYGDAWPPAAGDRLRDRAGCDIDHLVLDGLVYEHLANPSGEAPGETSRRGRSVARRRLRWLEGQSAVDIGDHFKPQAWVALSDRLARQGYGDDARQIEIARLRRERRGRGVSAGARWQSRLLDWFALYGHNPWRTVMWMAVVVVAFAGVWAGAAQRCADPGCFDESVMVVRNKDAYREERFKETYPAFHALAYSFDVFVPFVSFGYEDHWRPNIDYGPLAELPVPVPWAGGGSGKEPTIAITIGGVLYVLAIIEAILGIVLTSLLVTGFTGLLRGRGD